MSVVDISRWQFGITTVYHFIFVPLTIGLAPLVAIMQTVWTVTGTSADGTNAWRELGSWLRSLDAVHWTTVLVGVLSLALIFGLRFRVPAVPGALALSTKLRRAGS